jgi:hypothetical protein
MTLLLDTNVVSELRKRKPNAKVGAWSRTVSVDRLFVSAMTVMEIEQGILLVARRDARQAAALRAWMTGQFLLEFETRILPFDQASAMICATMHVPDPKPDRDSMIAATASVHGLTVVTRNTGDFAACGVPTFNPWLYEP